MLKSRKNSFNWKCSCNKTTIITIKSHQALGQALGSNLFTRLPVTFGSNQDSTTVIKIKLVKFPPREGQSWLQGSQAAVQKMKINALAFPYHSKNLFPPLTVNPTSTFEIQPLKLLFVFRASLFCLGGQLYNFKSRFESKTIRFLKENKSWSNSKANLA